MKLFRPEQKRKGLSILGFSKGKSEGIEGGIIVLFVGKRSVWGWSSFLDNRLHLDDVVKHEGCFCLLMDLYVSFVCIMTRKTFPGH